MDTTRGFVELGGEIGLILLLFTLGLEYSARELIDGVRSTPVPGVVDLVNGVPGFLAALLLGWGLLPALLLGGVTYISSSGIVAKHLRDSQRARAPEGRLVVSLLLVEDLVMAAFIPWPVPSPSVPVSPPSRGRPPRSSRSPRSSVSPCGSSASRAPPPGSHR